MFNMTRIIPTSGNGSNLTNAEVRHHPNDFGSRTPVIEQDAAWTGFTVPEWLRICTTDEKKRYK